MSADYSTFMPNPELMDSMLQMGIDTETAKIALYKTGNQSCDAAIAYVFDNPLAEPSAHDVPDVPLQMPSPHEKKRRARAEREHDVEADATPAYKMVFVVNAHLEMGMGKTAAQVAHAALGLYRLLREDETSNSEGLEYWEEEGEKCIVLRGQHERHLRDLRTTAMNGGLLTYLVQDAGLTEGAPGAVTVLTLFGQEEQVNAITGDLSLL